MNINTTSTDLTTVIVNAIATKIRNKIDEKKDEYLTEIYDQVKAVYEEECAKIAVEISKLVQISEWKDHLVITIYKKDLENRSGGKTDE